VYRRGGLGEVPNVEVLGITVETADLPDFDLEIWGRPHPDHVDMAPLGEPRPRGPRRWSIAMAHGHWFDGEHDAHRSWLIRQEELHRLDCDYVALGHWERAAAIGDGNVPAYYSGSPNTAQSINLVRFGETVQVERRPLAPRTPAG
jgi:hypothetical protein